MTPAETQFTIFAASLAALVAGGVVGSRTENPRVKGWATGVAAAAGILVFVTVVLGLWTAWSPWELTKK